LEVFLDQTADEHGFEIVVLDCHGGLDMVSLAAHQLSDHTLLIAEADRVTFNGTLELLDFYQATPRARAVAAVSNSTVSVDAGRLEGGNPIELIINRIPPKYTWDDLNRVYENVIATYQKDLNIADRILAYIPSEEFVAESFGELPFLVQVAPNSTMAQKLHLVVYKLFASVFDFPSTYKPLARLKNERRRRKIEQVLASAESRNIRAIVVTFALISNGYVLLFLGFVVYLVLWKEQGTTLADKVLGWGAALYFVLVSLFMLRAASGLKRYYKDKYQVYRNSLRALHQGPSFWKKIAILRLFFLRIATAILPYVVILTLVLEPLFFYGMYLALTQGRQPAR
jgi:MinD-like ATPase involved in chromosome partitioning or flagellar assembly